MNSFPERLAAHIVFFGIFLAAMINIGLFVDIPVTNFILPGSYALYVLGIAFIKLRRKQPIEQREIATVILIPILFLCGTYLFSKTYDLTWDGPHYHQTAVISLINGWNPIRDSQLNIPGPVGMFGSQGEFGKQFAEGYPKTLWLIDSSIAKFTGHINSAVIVNLLSGLAALILLFYTLTRFGISSIQALPIAVLSVIGPTFTWEFLSFMEDGFSYEISLIMIISLVHLASSKKKIPSLFLFISSWLLLVGTKYSNAYLGLFAGLMCIIILIRICILNPELLKDILKTLAGGAILSILILSNTFIANYFHYGSPIYPDNFAWARADLTIQNVPHNLTKANRLELLFYGIYSRVSASDDSNDPNDIARLKIPFAIYGTEFPSNEPASRVAGGGFWFSGLFSLSLIFLFMLWILHPTAKEERVVGIAVLIIILILGSALCLSTPNVFRYTPLITFIPSLTLITMLIIDGQRKFSWVRIGSLVLVILMTINTGSYLYLATRFDIKETNTIQGQLATLHNSGIIYNVYAPTFFSNYTRMAQAGIKINETQNVGCSNPQSLDYTYGDSATIFCPAS